MTADANFPGADGTGPSDGRASLPPISTRVNRVVQVSIAILAGLALIYALREARLFFMPTVLGALIALAATPLCALIERTGLPAAVSAFIVTVSLVAGLLTLGWYMFPSVDEWRYRAPEVAISLERKLRRLESKVEEVTETAAKVAPTLEKDTAETAGASGEGASEGTPDAAEQPKGAAEQIVEGGRRLFVNAIAAAPEILGALIYGFFLVYFLMAERRRVQRWAMMMATSRRQASRIARTIVEIRSTVGLYLATVSIINILLGVATAVCFWLIDMPAPILWGVFMALMNYMPYIGPLVVQACAFGVGFVTFNTTTEALYPVGILLALNTIEGQLVTPTVLGQRLSSSPLAVFLAVAFGAWMWGAVGAIVATPGLIALSGFARLWAREAQRQERLTRYAQEAMTRAEAEAEESLVAEERAEREAEERAEREAAEREERESGQETAAPPGATRTVAG